jgi:hypothetical protein
MITNLKPHGTGILTKNMSDPPVVIKGKFDNGELFEEVVLDQIIEEPIPLDSPDNIPREEEPGELDMDEPEILRSKSKEGKSEQQEKKEEVLEKETAQEQESSEKKVPEEGKEENSA